MVMLSQPTPPVSEFEARQLSIIFSQILESSCFAAIPRRTNSTTACEDWQSQIPMTFHIRIYFPGLPLCYLPSHATTRNSSSSEMSWTITSGYAVTICCSGASSALFLNSKSPIALDSARLPLTRPKSTKPPAAVILAFSPNSHVRLYSSLEVNHLLTFILRLVIKRKRLGSALHA